MMSFLVTGRHGIFLPVTACMRTLQQGGLKLQALLDAVETRWKDSPLASILHSFLT